MQESFNNTAKNLDFSFLTFVCLFALKLLKTNFAVKIVKEWNLFHVFDLSYNER